MKSDRIEKIRKRAYLLWEAEGFPHGRDEEHWLKAEREIDTAAVTAPRPKVTAKPPQSVPATRRKRTA